MKTIRVKRDKLKRYLVSVIFDCPNININNSEDFLSDILSLIIEDENIERLNTNHRDTQKENIKLLIDEFCDAVTDIKKIGREVLPDQKKGKRRVIMKAVFDYFGGKGEFSIGGQKNKYFDRCQPIFLENSPSPAPVSE